MQMPSLHQIRRSRPCLPADPHPRRCLLGHRGYGPGGGVAPRSAPSPIRSLPRMGPPTRGTVEIAHPRRSRPASPRAGLGRVLLGHSRYGPGWGRGLNAGARPIRSLPRMGPRPGALAVSHQRVAAASRLRGRSEVRPHGALRAGAGGRGSTAGAPAQYDLCPRWPDRPGALRVSCVEAASPVLLNTISAPDGPTTPGHCGYRRVTAIFYDPRPGGYPQGNRPMRGTGRISSGAPRVQDPGHPPSRPGAVTVALSDRLQPSRRS
jgi:hypothetical protein